MSAPPGVGIAPAVESVKLRTAPRPMPAARTVPLVGLATLAAVASCPAVEFVRDVLPVLTGQCVKCHGGVHAKGGLSFVRRDSAFSPAKSGATPIVPGKVGASELIARLVSDDPDERMPPAEPLDDAQIAAITEWVAGGAPWPEHWAFVPPEPEHRAETIDSLVARGLAAAGLQPSPPAPPHALVRRLYLDLLGLPPEPAVVREFAADPSPAAYRDLVERLLASPHFGERWARHWLDAARYADSDGYEKDKGRPDAWRYRKWVIDAINADMPFDQFTVEQLAGDLLPGATPEQQLATAFHRQTLFNREGGVDPEEDRTKRTIDRTNTTASVWLGLTAECAQCHDHPYDPFSQRDFYALYAFFNDATEASAQVPAGPDADARGKAPLMDVRVMAERRRETYRFHRGDFLQPDREGGEIAPGTPAGLPGIGGEGRRATRLDLARWIGSADNPLAARVAADDIWRRLFGDGLAATRGDWGTRSAPPVQAELLDHLALRLVELGWSRKALIREIALSRTYRQDSLHRPDLAAADPDNALLGRQNRFRVEAEIVRDLFLSAAGLLEHKVGGPSVFPPIPADVATQSYANNFKWKTSGGADRYRRGMYTFFKRTAPDPNLLAFDCPDANVSSPVRGESNTPLMALATLGNPVFHEASQALAKRLLEAPGRRDRDGRLQLAFELCLARPPSATEGRQIALLVEGARRHYQGDEAAAEALVGAHRAAGSTLPENAAWVAAARIVLNLDETLTRQ